MEHIVDFFGKRSVNKVTSVVMAVILAMGICVPTSSFGNVAQAVEGGDGVSAVATDSMQSASVSPQAQEPSDGGLVPAASDTLQDPKSTIHTVTVHAPEGRMFDEDKGTAEFKDADTALLKVEENTTIGSAYEASDLPQLKAVDSEEDAPALKSYQKVDPGQVDASDSPLVSEKDFLETVVHEDYEVVASTHDSDVQPAEEADEADATEAAEPTDLTPEEIAAASEGGIMPMAENDIYWNPSNKDITDENGNVVSPAGNDSGSGSAKYPVLTWAKAYQMARESGADIIFMSTVVLGDTDCGAEVPANWNLDGADDQGSPAIVLRQYDSLPAAIMVAPDTTLTLKDVSILPATGTGNPVIDIVQPEVSESYAPGKLMIDKGAVVGGQIQFEFNGVSKQNITPITLTDNWLAQTDKQDYTLYCSSINDNQTYDQVDIVVPATDAHPTDMKLIDHFTLSDKNTDAEWTIRQHKEKDGSWTNAIQLNRVYKYTGVYIDGVNGNDEYFGGNCKYPVKTFARAKELLQDSVWADGVTERVIYVCDTIQVDDAQTWTLPDAADSSYTARMEPCSLSNKAGEGNEQPLQGAMVNVKDGGNLTIGGSDKLEMVHKTNVFTATGVNVEAGGTLTLDDGATLRAGTSDTAALRGTGVTVAGGSAKTTTVNIKDGAKIAYFTQGINMVGVQDDTTAVTTLNMTGGSVTGNNQFSYARDGWEHSGAGVHVDHAVFNMSGGSIDTNYVRGNSRNNWNYGGGVMVNGATAQFNMSGGVIDNNHGYCYYMGGAGVALLGASKSTISDDAVISNNWAANSYNGGISAYSSGGGILMDGNSTLKMSGGTIQGNQASWNNDQQWGGGGLLVHNSLFTMTGGTFEGNYATTGGAIQTYNHSGTNGVNAGVSITGGTFKNNGAYYYGGAIDHYSSAAFPLTIADSTFTGNGKLRGNNTTTDEGTPYGGALFLDHLSPVTITNCEFTDNLAQRGAALYTANRLAASLDKDTKVTDNVATIGGGGLCASYGVITVDGSTVTGNKVVKVGTTETVGGGGAYTITEGRIDFINNPTVTGNVAENGKGDAIYSAADIGLMSGTFDSSDTADHKYGIYLDALGHISNNSRTCYNYIDPSAIDAGDLSINTKIYINTPTSKITALTPTDKTAAKLPVSVNDDEKIGFSVGSVVVTPIASKTTLSKKVYQTSAFPSDGAETDTPYYTGGVIPNGTQMGGFNKNVILVGEGVYIDGQKGDDSRDGTSPNTAVKTWSKARELLVKYIADHKADTSDPDGFNPYIWVCGQVDITPSTLAKDSSWELDPTKTELIQTNNPITPQVKRFASYNGVMVNVKDVGNFEAHDILMDGNSVGVDGGKATGDYTVRVVSGAATLNGGAILQNSYNTAIYVYSANASCTMNADSIVKRSNSREVLVDNGTFVMNGDAVVDHSHYQDAHLRTTYAISLSGSAAAMTMNERASVLGAEGIEGVDTTSGRIGVEVYNKASLAMNDNSFIRAYTDCIFVNAGGTVVMDDDTYLAPSAYTVAHNVYQGQAINANGNDTDITIKGNACVRGSETIDGNTGGFLYGMQVSSSNGAKFSMEGDASIVGARERGIFLNYYASNTNITLSDNSHISDCGYRVGTFADAGIFMDHKDNEANNHVITLNDNAYIGGNGSDVQGNTRGISSYGSGFTINLNDDAAISYNDQEGIFNTKQYYSASIATHNNVNLAGSSTISNNGTDGVRQTDYQNGGVVYSSIFDIAVNDTASIKDNGSRAANLQGLNSSISFADGASVSGNKSTEELGKAIYTQGTVTVGGQTKIDNEIYLLDSASSTKFITLTSAVPADNEFSVGYPDNFIGQDFVHPDGTGITDATPYLDKFVPLHKPEKGDVVYGLITEDVNLVVKGENNVYLAGDALVNIGLAPGDDRNNGASVGAPVRTLARALEILKTKDPGANIIICNYPVIPATTPDENGVVKYDDSVWQYNAAGTSDFTNDNGDTWTPLVQRGTNLLNSCPMVEYNSNQTHTMNGIVLDGNVDEYTAEGLTLPCMPMVMAGYIYKRSSGTGINAYDAPGVTANFNNVTFQNSTNDVIRDGNLRGVALTTWSDAKVNMDGCTITGITGLRGQPAINLGWNSVATLKNTSISDNTSTGNTTIYGIIHLQNSAELTMTDCAVDNNKAVATNGSTSLGIIFSEAANKLTIDGSTTINNNTVQSVGGLVYAPVNLRGSGTTAINGNVSIANNTVTSRYSNGSENPNAVWGAGVLAEGTHNLTLFGATIDNNNGGTHGGGVVVSGSANVHVVNANITNNHARYGSGVYLSSSNASLIQQGGLISGNTPAGETAPTRFDQAGVYINSPNYQLRGGATNISDYIYLTSKNNPITLSRSIYQAGRLYKLDLNTNSYDSNRFQKGSVVVKADGDAVLDAAVFQKYFTASAAGLVLEQQSPNLVLKQCIFIDSDKGSDANSGSNPDNAVATFAGAKNAGGAGDYVVYISGPIRPNGAETWSLPDSSWMCRYSGWNCWGQDYPAYTGPLVVLDNGDNLTLGNTAANQGLDIRGKREIDEISGGPIFQVGDGATVTMTAAASTADPAKVVKLSDNTNKSNGAAFFVEPGGQVNIAGGTVQSMQASKGALAYLDVKDNGDGTYSEGKLALSGTPNLSGEVYLNGATSADDGSAAMTADASFNPADPLSVNMANPFMKREVVTYTDGSVPDAESRAHYELARDILAVFSLNNRAAATSTLELQQKGSVYIDGVNGSDANDGLAPLGAVKTLKRAYEILAAQGNGGLITVVDTVTIADTERIMNTTAANGVLNARYDTGAGSSYIDAGAAVYIRRYSQPTDWKTLDNAADFNKASFTGSLFEVAAGGSFTDQAVTIDGHGNEVLGTKEFTAPGVESHAALVNVKTGGTFITLSGTKLLSNNNVDATVNIGAGVSINGGTYSQQGGQLTDMKAQDDVVVYQNGTYQVRAIGEEAPTVDGKIYLTGNGSASSSHYIDVIANSAEFPTDVLIEDPYNGRTVQKFLTGFVPSKDHIAAVSLETSVTDLYQLGKRDAETNVLELQYRPAVYIDGVNGNDSNAGDTPDSSVKTLAQAYKLLADNNGGVLYVVDTVTTPTDDVTITNQGYMDNSVTTTLAAGHVDIMRYVKPDQGATPFVGYSHATNLNPLFTVPSGALLTAGDVAIDGHYNPLVGEQYSPTVRVAAKTEVNSPLFTTDAGGKLTLSEGAVLSNNWNTSTANPTMTYTGTGGVLYNKGQAEFAGATFTNNSATKGSGVFQMGTFTIASGYKGIGDHQLYLGTDNSGTTAAPVWGADHWLNIQDVELKKDTAWEFNWDLDNPVRGRNIVTYDSTDAFNGPTVMSETAQYPYPASIDQNKLLKVSSVTETNTIELQTYDVIYHDNGAKSGDVPVDSNNAYVPGGKATVLGNVAADPLVAPDGGYQFVGWNTAADGSGTSYYAGDKVTMNSNVDLYAMWFKADKQVSQPEEDVLRPGAVLTYTITLTLPQDGKGITVTDNIPANTTYVENSADGGGTFANGVVTWDVGDKSAGDTITLSFKVTVNDTTAADTVVNNTASVDMNDHTYTTTGTTSTVGATYKVTYLGNTNTDGVPPVDSAHYVKDETVTVLPLGTDNPIKKVGYEFSEWNTEADGTGTSYDPADTFKMPEADVVLYAQWSEVDITITYNAAANGKVNVIDSDPVTTAATTSETLKSESGTAVGTTAVPNPGYKFVNWTDADGNQVSTAATFVPAKIDGINMPTTYTANFDEAENIDIIYTSAQPAIGTVSPNSESLKPATGEAKGSTATPKPGYHFVNWTVGDTTTVAGTDATLTKAQVDAVAKTTGAYVSTTFKANFAENDAVKLNFVSEDTAKGTVDPASNDSVKPATGTPAGSTATAKPGYHFVNWTKAGDTNWSSTSATLVANNLKNNDGIFVADTFTAHFAEDDAVAITYTADAHGSVSSAGESLAPVTGVAAGSVATADTGYHFSHWTKAGDTSWKSEDANFKPAKVDGLNVAADYTAHFAPNEDTAYTVEHFQQALDGTWPTTAFETENKTGTTGNMTAATAKTYEGFTAQAITQKVIAADGTTVVQIKYDRNKHNVTYNANGHGSAPAAVNDIRFGALLNEPTAPTAPGYTFGGWYTQQNTSDDSAWTFDTNTMPDENLTLYAKWTPIIYKVNFDIANHETHADLSGNDEQKVAYTDHAEDACTVTIKDADKNDYLHLGWIYDYTAADGSQQTGYEAGATGYTNVEVLGDVTFRAVLAKIPFMSGVATNGLIALTAGGLTEGSALTPTEVSTTLEMSFDDLPEAVAGKIKPKNENYEFEKLTVTDFNDPANSIDLIDGQNTFHTTLRDLSPVDVTITFNSTTGVFYTSDNVDTSMQFQAVYRVIKTTYTVEHYCANIDGTYPATPTETQMLPASDPRADAGSTIILAPKTYPNLSYDASLTTYADSAHTTASTTVLPVKYDASTVVKLYYPRNQNDVLFHSNGHGTDPTTQTDVYAGSTDTQAPADAATAMTAPGYTWDGTWYTDAACTTEWDFATGVMPDENLNLFGKWTEDDVVLNYASEDVNKGTVSPATETIKAEHGSAAGSTATAVAGSGYHFDHWSKASDSTWSSTVAAFTPEKSSDGVYVPETYTAHFVEDDPVTITYKVNDETRGSVTPESEALPPATGVAAGSTAAAIEGYHFVNWTDANGIEVGTDATFVPAKLGTLWEATDYTANFEPNKYDAVTDPNNGDDETTISGEYGKPIPKPTDPTKPDSVFEGWYTPDGEEWDFDTMTMPIGGITLTAKYKPATPAIDDPPVSKIYAGTAAPNATFTFQLKAVSNTAGKTTMPMPGGGTQQTMTATAVGAGSVEFGTVSFDKSGTYIYEVTEVNDNQSNWQYSNVVYTVKYEVSQDGDKLVSKRTITNAAGESAESAAFTNTYQPAVTPVAKAITTAKTGDNMLYTGGAVALMGMVALGIAALARRKRESDDC